jgi:uncharacterized membrane protein
VFLLCREQDPCSLYLGAMITGMDIFIECIYGSNTGIAAATLYGVLSVRSSSTSNNHKMEDQNLKLLAWKDHGCK